MDGGSLQDIGTCHASRSSFKPLSMALVYLPLTKYLFYQTLFVFICSICYCIVQCLMY